MQSPARGAGYARMWLLVHVFTQASSDRQVLLPDDNVLEAVSRGDLRPGNNPRSLLAVSALANAAVSLWSPLAGPLKRQDKVALEAAKEGMEK